MKKTFLLGMGLCLALAFTSCKSSESAYKKAYEKAKQAELAAEAARAENTYNQQVTPVQPTTPTNNYTPSAGVREERVELVSGVGLKAYSVVCGSFGVKANADNLKATLEKDGYNAKVVFNAERNMYRVITESYDTRDEAARARDAFKSKYPNRQDFQGAWLLYRLN